MTFTPPDHQPPQPSTGFTAGVLTIEWTGETWSTPSGLRTPARTVHGAQITNIDTPTGALNRDVTHRALTGLVVRAPDGALARIAAVESFATMSLTTGTVGRLGIALERLT